MKGLVALARRNERLVRNLFGAAIFRMASLVVGLATMPAYIRFFPDKEFLGVWFTVVSLFNVLLSFDIGVGNGLRVRVVKPLAEGDRVRTREVISSAYAVSTLLATGLALVGVALLVVVDWSAVFRLSAEQMGLADLRAVLIILWLGLCAQLLLKNVVSLLFALQRNNLAGALNLASAVGLLVFLLTWPSHSLALDMLTLSVANAVCFALPLAVATGALFRSVLVGVAPSTRHVTRDGVASVMGIGTMFLVIQLGLVVITSSDPILISTLYSSSAVVDQQAYQRVFGALSMTFAVLTQPVWSAIAHHAANCNLHWIRRARGMMLWAATAGTAASLLLAFGMPRLLKVWLGKDAVDGSLAVALVFAALTAADMFVIAITCIGNGVGDVKAQAVSAVAGALVKIPLSVLVRALTDEWTSVVVVHIVCLLPICLAQSWSLQRWFAARAESPQPVLER